MNYKILTKNIDLDWDFSATKPSFLEQSFNIFEGKLFNVKIFDNETNLLIKEDKDISISKDNIYDALWLYGFNLEEDVPLEFVFAPPRSLRSLTSNNKVAKQKYIYDLSSNSNDFLKNKNKIGFFKNLKFVIQSENFFNEINVEYSNLILEQDKIDKIFIDVLKSSDNFGVKLILNSDLVSQHKINAFYIRPYKYQNNQKIKLNSITIDNIEEKWLDNNQNIKVLTLPLNDIVLDDDIIEVEIFYLCQEQIDIINFFKLKMSQNDLDKFIIENFTYQIYKPNLIYKENSSNQTVGYFHGLIYLFNNQSFENLNWPDQDIDLLNIKFNKYFVKSNKDTENYSLSIENEMVVSDALIEESSLPINILNESLGYYLNNNGSLIYQDFNKDIPYFKNNNIKKMSILSIEENLNKTSIYLECVTPFENINEIYLETSTTNLFFVKKYIKEIDGKSYASFLLRYEYSNELTAYFLTNNSINKDRIIQGKRNINFNIKLY